MSGIFLVVREIVVNRYIKFFYFFWEGVEGEYIKNMLILEINKYCEVNKIR